MGLGIFGIDKELVNYEIKDVWDIPTVQNRLDEKEISIEDAKLILERMENDHDANEGYNWSQVDIAYNNLVREGILEEPTNIIAEGDKYCHECSTMNEPWVDKCETCGEEL